VNDFSKGTAMAKVTKVSVDPKELKRAEEMWGIFTDMAKWTIVSVIVLLVILAATRL
jgi:hypothetical protein